MKSTILAWAALGFAVAAGWAVFAMAAGPEVNIASNSLRWTIAQLTCPIVFAGTYFHFGVRLEWVLLTNAAIYALVGAAVYVIQQRLRHATT